MARPRGLNEGVAALLGAGLVLVLRLVPPGEALRVEGESWNVFLFFLGMMAVAALADQSGVFDTVAGACIQLAGGRVAALYALIFAVGALISLLFANDTAALVLTPIVYTLVLRLSLDPLPFVFATTFVADTASIGLPVSNPLNVIVSDSFGLGLAGYVGHLWLPALLVVSINAAVFGVLFRHGLRGRFRSSSSSAPPRHSRPSTTFLLLGILALTYLIASALTFPLGVVAVCGAIALALNLLRLQMLAPHRLAREIGWPIFGFIGGMLVVVQGLHDTGVTAGLGQALLHAASGSGPNTIAAVVVGTALGANLINNLPMALVMTSAVHGVHLGSVQRSQVLYSTVLGCDLGPNLTHLGSLATFIWLFFLRRKGLDVSTWDYFRVGVIVTPLMLVGAILGLWLTFTY